MPRESFHFFYDNTTPRPGWAGSVNIDYETVSISASHSDVRAARDRAVAKGRGSVSPAMARAQAAKAMSAGVSGVGADAATTGAGIPPAMARAQAAKAAFAGVSVHTHSPAVRAAAGAGGGSSAAAGTVGRGGGGGGGATINRPKYIVGYILPTGTSGRKPVNAPARDLSGRDQDRGHIMALSLGGPNVPLNIVPQPSEVNRAIGRDFSLAGDLLWREMEIYLEFCAAFAMLNNDSRTDDLIRIFQKQIRVGRRREGLFLEFKGAGSRRTLFNIHDLISKLNYSERANPKFKVQFDATVIYPHKDRDNFPSNITVRAYLADRSSGTQFYNQTFSMKSSISRQYERLEAIRHAAREESAARRASQAYKDEHGVGGR